MRNIIGRIVHTIGLMFSRIGIDWFDDGISVPPPKLSRMFFELGGRLEEWGDRQLPINR